MYQEWIYPSSFSDWELNKSSEDFLMPRACFLYLSIFAYNFLVSSLRSSISFCLASYSILAFLLSSSIFSSAFQPSLTLYATDPSIANTANPIPAFVWVLKPDLFFSLLSGQVLHISACELGMMFSKCPPLTFSRQLIFFILQVWISSCLSQKKES